jgi:peptidylprolyl isomerase
MRIFSLISALLACAALVFAGCGEQAQDRRDSAADSKPPAAPVAPKTISTDLSKKPGVPKLSGPIPTTLTKKDVVVGTGKEAKKGDKVSVQYVGVLADSTTDEFDSSWDAGKPLDFQLGKGAVIKGWDDGIPGMKEGGRRELIIPADLAYGAQGSPPSIGPNQPLIFVVDLKKVG